MKREILFRVWDKDLQEMFIPGSLTQSKTKGIIDCGSVIFPDEGVLMQYTGLKDINGVKIFEGDVVTIPNWARSENGITEKIGVVYFGDGEFALKKVSSKEAIQIWDDGNYSIYSMHHITPEMEIIGNIHQNPELLT